MPPRQKLRRPPLRTRWTGGYSQKSRSRSTSDVHIPYALEILAAWSWRILLFGAVLFGFVFLLVQIQIIVIALVIAILLSAVLVPLRDILLRAKWPKWISIVTTFLVFLFSLGALIALVISQIFAELEIAQQMVLNIYHDFQLWLSQGPLELTTEQIAVLKEDIAKWVQSDTVRIALGTFSLGVNIGHFLSGILLVLFCLLFILIDGERIWLWFVQILPLNARAAVDGAGKKGWATLRNFVTVQIFVALVDAIGISLGAMLLGLPLVAPIFLVVFFGGAIPIIGAIVSGIFAVLVALIFGGILPAILMLIIVLAVQQIESNVLHPLIMGKAVRVHPLAVGLSVVAGSIVAGIAGALFAVPLVAVVNVMIKYWSSGEWKDHTFVAQKRMAEQIWQTVPATSTIHLRKRKRSDSDST